MELIDYAFSRPAPAAIKAAGYVGVVRYLAHSTAKALTKAEADGLLAAGLDISLVFEDGATNASEGQNQGLLDGTFARQQAQAIGVPETATIYAAVDENVVWGAVAPYFVGFKQGLAGYYEIGVYGSYQITVGFQAAGYLWAWQTVAWSGGQINHNAHVFQSGAQTTVGGALVDVNEVFQIPHGSWLQALRTPLQGDTDMGFRVYQDPRSAAQWAVGNLWAVGMDSPAETTIWLSMPDCLSKAVETPDAAHWDQIMRTIPLKAASGTVAFPVPAAAPPVVVGAPSAADVATATVAELASKLA